MNRQDHVVCLENLDGQDEEVTQEMVELIQKEPKVREINMFFLAASTHTLNSFFYNMLLGVRGESGQPGLSGLPGYPGEVGLRGNDGNYGPMVNVIEYDIFQKLSYSYEIYY